MKNLLLIITIFVGSIAFSQSYKNIDKYTTENTKVVYFSIDTARFLTEEILVLSKVLYSYPDIYFADVDVDGKGIAFIAKSSLFEKLLDELYDKKSYVITNISYDNYSDDIFENAYNNSRFKNRKNNGKVILGISDKDDLNYNIAFQFINK